MRLYVVPMRKSFRSQAKLKNKKYQRWMQKEICLGRESSHECMPSNAEKRLRGSSSAQSHSQHESHIAELETRLKAQEKEMEEMLKAQEEETEARFKKQEEERVEKEADFKKQLLVFHKTLESMRKYFSESQGHADFDFSLPPF